jgi:hypothetical protein
VIWGDPASLSHVEGGPVEIQLWLVPDENEVALAGAGDVGDVWPDQLLQQLSEASWGGFALVPADRQETVEHDHDAIAQLLDDDTPPYRVALRDFLSKSWPDGRRILPLVGVGEPPRALAQSSGMERVPSASNIALGSIDEVLKLADQIIDAQDDADDVAWAEMLRPGLQRLREYVEDGGVPPEDERELRAQLASTARRILALAKASVPLVTLARLVLQLLGVG